MALSVSQIDKERILKGIAAYFHEQKVLLRLLRKRKQFTEKEFDGWFKGREFRRGIKLSGRGITGDSFILGIGVNGFNQWATYLDLMQHMIAIDLISARKENGLITYRLRI